VGCFRTSEVLKSRSWILGGAFLEMIIKMKNSEKYQMFSSIGFEELKTKQRKVDTLGDQKMPSLPDLIQKIGS